MRPWDQLRWHRPLRNLWAGWRSLSPTVNETSACPQTLGRRRLPDIDTSEMTDAQSAWLGPLLPPQTPATIPPRSTALLWL